MLMILVDLTSLMLIFSHQISIQGRESYLGDLVTPLLPPPPTPPPPPPPLLPNWHCVQTLGVIDNTSIDTAKLRSLMPVWITFIFIQSHRKMKIKNFCVHLLATWSINLDEIQYATTILDLLKLMLNLFCTSSIQGREFCWLDFMRCMFSIVMFQEPCKMIYFKLGIMLITTKLYSVIPVRITLMSTQRHRVTGNLELVQSFCW